jgi:Flp pilus assembly pilin Flp
MMIEWIGQFVRDEAGQSVIEYSLLMTLIGASTVFMATLMGFSIGQMVGVNGMTVERYTEWAIEKYRER